MAFMQGGMNRRDIISKGGRGAVGIVVLGVPELEKAFKQLSTSGANRAATSALRAGLVPVVKAIKREARAKTQKVTGLLVGSIGSRLRKSRRNRQQEAVAGFNVASTKAGSRLTKTGKTVKTRVLAPHAHLVALGTVPRFRNRIGGKFAFMENGNLPKDKRRTGKMGGIPIVPTAYNASKAASLAAMKAKALKQIDKEVLKARAKK